MILEPISDNVFRCAESPAMLDGAVFGTLVAAAGRSPLRRARVCMHPEPNASIHEMLIVLLRGTYIRPHKHLGKSESFHLIRGTAGVAFFNDDGRIEQRRILSREVPAAPFYYRLDREIFHAQAVLSDFVVFHECTQGPFRRTDTVFAPWSPAEGTADVPAYLARLETEFAEAAIHV